MVSDNSSQVCITGYGIISHQFNSNEKFTRGNPEPTLAHESTEGGGLSFTFLDSIDFDVESKIPKRRDRKLMGKQFQLGCCAAGLALEMAGLSEMPQLLANTNLYCASRGGERDAQADAKLRTMIYGMELNEGTSKINELLSKHLRPTLYLGQLPNLLASNISITQKVLGNSRTFLGEEMAGVASVETAYSEITAGEAELVLVGGALSSSSIAMLEWFYGSGQALVDDFSNIWERGENGVCLGTVGAFLVLESKKHAGDRGANILATVEMLLRGTLSRDDAGYSDELAKIVQDTSADFTVTNLHGGRRTSREQGLWDHGGEHPVLSTAGNFGSCLEVDLYVQMICAAQYLNGSENVLNPEYGSMNRRLTPTADISSIDVICFGMERGEAALRLRGVE